MGSFSIGHGRIGLLSVVMILGTKKLKNMGTDLGGAVKGFKDGMKEGSSEADKAPAGQVTNTATAAKETIDVQAKEKT